MADAWQTFKGECVGGLILNEDQHTLGERAPGAAISLINFEPSVDGGYKRISGYSKYDSTVLPGTGVVQGCAVYGSGVIAARQDDLYRSTGSGWTKISSAPLTGATKFRYAKYDWVTPVITFVAGVGRPVKWDGTTYTVLSSGPVAATCVAEFRNHLFFGVGNSLISSEPNDDTGYSGVDGAVDINVGDTIVNIKEFRDNLFIFCENSIKRLTGSSSADFALVPVTSNIGCIAADSVQEIGGDLIFLAPDGLRPVAGTDRNNDFELSTISRPVNRRIEALIGADDVVSCVIRGKTQYRLIPRFSGRTAMDTLGIIGGIRTTTGYQGWEWGELQGFAATCADSGYIGDDEYVIHGDENGYVYRQEFGNDFDGTNIIATYQTPYITFGDISFRKTLYTISLYTETVGQQGVALNVLFDYETANTIQPPQVDMSVTQGGLFFFGGGTSLFGSATFGGPQSPVVRQNLIGSGFTASLKFTSSDSNPPYAIKSYVIEYAVNGRR